MHISVELCIPGGARPPETVLLLIAGGTYGRTYWDLPDPSGGTDKYSFVAAAMKAGYATLAVDTLGRGASSRPSSQEITLSADAWICDQLVQGLRGAAIDGPDGVVSFSNVVAVGHSLGTATIWLQASRYRGLDGLILTGNAHHRSGNIPQFVPARADPMFAMLDLDDGYVTTAAGQRASAFYEPGRYESALADWDEKHKDVCTMAQRQESASLAAVPADIRAPTLMVLGALDWFYSVREATGKVENVDELLKSEGPYLGTKLPSLDGYLLAETGHSINGALHAEEWFSVAMDWLDDHVGGAVRDGSTGKARDPGPL